MNTITLHRSLNAVFATAGVISLLLLPQWVMADSARIIIDGEFSDWDGIEPVALDQTGGENPGDTDFASLWVANDERHVFICFEITQEINLQSENQIRLLLDTDNNAETGVEARGLGAELVWTFGSRTGTFTTSSGTQQVWHNQVGLVAAPTVTSKRFEIALERSARPNGSDALFPGETVRIAMEDAGGRDVIPDGSGGAVYAVDDSPLPALPSLSLSRDNSADVRILSYNVLFDGFFEPGRRASFNRLLAAIEPDIIGFQEIYNHSALETQSRVESILPSSGQDRWYSAKAGPDIIAVSRFPIREHFTVTGNGAFLIDLRPDYETEMLLIVAHPPCCSGQSNEAARQREIDAFMAFVRDAKATGGALDLIPDTPIVIVGDMNLVGYRQQLETMLTGNIVNVSTYGPPFSPDWDGTDLEDARPRAWGLPMAFTWYDEWGSYWPGRLDYIVYSGSIMEMGNSFVAFTPEMPQDTLMAYGLEAEDAVTASDHLPVVADFSLPVSTARLDIHCLDVGHGDCTLITAPNGGTFLLDAGPDGKGEEVVIPYLDGLGISALDYICVSNYNPERVGGMDEVIEHIGIDSVRVAVMDRGYGTSGEAYDAYAASAGSKRTAITRGQSIDLGGGVSVTCVGVNSNGLLEPPYDDRYDEGDLSIAFLVKYLGFDLFVAGDVGGVEMAGHTDIESALAPEVGDIDCYIVSDHGGPYSSNEKLLSALLPEVALISVGNQGPAGYPSQAVIDRLADYKAYIYQTESGRGGRMSGGNGEVVNGPVVIKVKARSYTVNQTDTYAVEQDGVAISSLKENDENGEPVLLGNRVILRGVATVASGVFSLSDNDIFVQDATGGVNVFDDPGIDPVIHVGDKVEVEGFVDIFAGLTRITSPTMRIVASDVRVPGAVPLETVDIASDGALYEGSLVELSGVQITQGTWPPTGSDGVLTIDDGSGECEIFIDEDTDIPGPPEMPDTFDVIGIVAQYDLTFPYLSGYRVLPRSREDIRAVGGDSGLEGPGVVARILPNPARRNIRIRFTSRALDHVKHIVLYDVSGRQVAQVQAGAGTAFLDWAARDDSASPVAGGIYFLVARAGGREETHKIVIMR